MDYVAILILVPIWIIEEINFLNRSKMLIVQEMEEGGTKNAVV